MKSQKARTRCLSWQQRAQRFQKARQRRGVRWQRCQGHLASATPLSERGEAQRPKNAVRHATAVSRPSLPPHSTTLARRSAALLEGATPFVQDLTPFLPAPSSFIPPLHACHRAPHPLLHLRLRHLQGLQKSDIVPPHPLRVRMLQPQAAHQDAQGPPHQRLGLHLPIRGLK